MKEFRLYDRNFLGDDSSSHYHSPQKLKWIRSGPDTDVTFFTDVEFQKAPLSKAKTKIAWLLEPVEISPYPYIEVSDLIEHFDLVLTHHQSILDRGPKYIFYPNGMSWVASPDWREYEKKKNVSIIASAKEATSGHRLRHQVVSAAKGMIDVFGRGYQPVEHKVEALSRYRFSVAIENSSVPCYFTEKLLDCFATFTVPIYWGCPGIGKFFDPRGMILTESKDDLVDAIRHVANDSTNAAYLYEQMLPFIRKNYTTAKQYKVAEDWIFENILVPRGLV